MSIEIKVPPLPESVSDATLVAWHKSVGEGVARDENLVDLETDKVVLEVPAPASGTLTKIVVEDGATDARGAVGLEFYAAFEIEGVDLQPCGGTHVRSTSEVGAVRIGKVENKGRQNRRVNIHLDD